MIVTEPILHIRKLRPREAVNNRVEQWKLGAILLVLLPTKVSLLPLTTVRFIVSQQYIQKHLETLSRPLSLAVEGLAHKSSSFVLNLHLPQMSSQRAMTFAGKLLPPHPTPCLGSYLTTRLCATVGQVWSLGCVLNLKVQLQAFMELFLSENLQWALPHLSSVNVPRTLAGSLIPDLQIVGLETARNRK